MITDFAIALVDEVNAHLKPQPVLASINFHADKVQHSGATLKAFCPIHKDSRFRSLLIDGERRAFRCTIKTCQGYAGGSLLELYALSRSMSLVSAACELVQHLELELEPAWRDQLVESYLKDATAAMSRGDLTEAETLLRELICVAPQLPDARIMLANIQSEMGDPQGAAEEYTYVIDQFLASDRLDDADTLATTALDRFPDNEDLLFVRVKIAEAQDDHALAIAHMQQIIELREVSHRHLDNIGLLEQLVQKVPEQPEFAIKLAELYEQQHNLRAASRQYENAAKQYLVKGQKSEGIELLEKVVQYNGENVRARLELAAHLAENNQIDRARDHTFRAVNQQIDQQEFGLAVSTVNGWLEREPANIDAREFLTRIYLDQDRPEEAAKYLMEGAELAAITEDHSRAADLLLRAKFLLPDAVELRRRLIQEFVATGEQQRAAFEVVDLAEILFSSDEADDAVLLLSDGLTKNISLPLKLQMISALAKHKCALALEHLHSLAQAMKVSPQPDEQADIYEMLSRLEPQNSDNHVRHVQALWTISPERAADAAAEGIHWLLQNGIKAEAERLLELVVTQLEDYVPAAPRLLEQCEQCGRLDLTQTLYQVSIQSLAEQNAEAGLKAARRMLALNPAHPSAPSDIAFLLATTGQTEEAAEQYAHVSAMLRDSGDYETALQYAREAAELNPISIKALALQALLGQELLAPEENAALAEDLLRQGRETQDPNVAASAYLTYIDLYPNDEKILAEAAIKLGNLEAPEAVAQVQSRQASRLSAAGDWDGARNILQVAAGNAAEFGPIHEQLGEACKITGDNNTAAIAFATASIAYARLGDVDNSVRCVNSAQQADPQSSDAWESLYRAAETIGLVEVMQTAAQKLTMLFAQSDSPPSTARWAREWVRLSPSTAEAHHMLGQALTSIDQSANAGQSLSMAAKLYTGNGKAVEALQALRLAASVGNLSHEDSNVLVEISNNEPPGSAVHAQATELLGSILVGSGDLDGARRLASTLPEDRAATLWTQIAKAESSPFLATADYLQAARVLNNSGDTSEAVNRLQIALSLDPADIEAHRFLADLLFSEGRIDEALPHQLHILQKTLDDKTSDLLPVISKLRTTYAGSTDALIEMARILLKAGHPDLALQNLESAAEQAVNSNNAAALVTICGLDETLTRQSVTLTRARADSLMGMDNVQQALEWVSTSGRQLLNAGKADEALEMAERWASLTAKDPEAYRLQADALLSIGRTDDANAARITAARLIADAGNVPAALAEIEIVLQNEAHSESGLRLKADLLKAVNDKDAASATLARLGDIQVAAGEDEKALKSYRSCLELAPDNTDALWNQAEIIRKVQGPAAARTYYRQWADVRRLTVSQVQWIEDLQQLLKIIPDSAGVLRDLIDALLASGRTVDAEPHLKNLAMLLETEGDYTGAAQALETAIARSSVANPAQLKNIAELYRKGDKPSIAIDHLRQAGRTYSAEGNNREAFDVLMSLLKLAGDSALPEDLALAAATCAATGDTAEAVRMIDQALEALQQQSANQQRREAILSQALEIAPLNPDYVLMHMDLLPRTRAMTQGLNVAQKMTAAGRPDDSIRILTRVVSLAPHDMSLRQEIFQPLRLTGNIKRLRQELQELAGDALAAGDIDAAAAALDELGTLASSAQQFRVVAELNERARRTEKAAEQFAATAVLYADEGRTELSIANINRAFSADPFALPAEQMAELVHKLGPDVHDIAREQLRSALTARRQKQSQVLALALLDSANQQRSAEILKTIATLGGSTFVVGIARTRINNLLEKEDLQGAVEFTDSLMEIVPDSPDAWYLTARVKRQSGNASDARRSALEAARLFNTAGAVIEEEECYKEALAAEPDNLAIKSAMADYLAREHREDEAVSLLLQVIASAEASGDSDVLLDSLNRAVQVAPGNTDLREKLAKTLETIAPDSAIDNWLHLASLFHEDDQLDRARRVYAHILTLHPLNEAALQGLLNDAKTTGNLENFSRYTVELADIKASRKNVGEACRLYQSYLELDPDNLDVLERLSALAGTSNNAEVFSTTTRALARKFQKIGDNESALRHYELLAVRYPRDAALLAALLDCSAAACNAEKGLIYARQLLAVARETEDPERIRLAAATILNYDPEDASAHNDLGEALLSLNRIPQAVTEWLRAAELFEGADNTAAAFTCYRRITQISPGTLQAWRRLGDLALAVGETETARMCLFHVLDKTGDRDKLRVAPLLSKLLQAIPEDYDVHQTALEYFRRTGDIDKAVAEVLWFSEWAEKAGDADKSATILADALTWAPGNKDLKSTHYRIARQLGRLEELQIRLRNEAENHEKTGNMDEALAILRELAEISPSNIPLRRDLARLLEKDDHLEEAIEQHLGVIHLLLDRSELEQARDYAEDIVSRYPSHENCRILIADLLVKNAYPDLAARYYRSAAEAAGSQKNLDAAINLLEKAVSARPSWSEAREALATVCEKAGKTDEAFQARIGLVQSLIEAGELYEATATLDQLRQLRPESPEIREQLAELHGKAGHKEQQVDVLKELSALYESHGDARQALDVYRKLASLVPEDPAVLSRYLEILTEADVPPEELPQEYTRLAEAFALRGDYEAATQSYEQALGLAPENTASRSRYATFLLSRGSRSRALSEMRTLAGLYTDRNEPAAAVEVLNAALTISPRDADLCLALATAQEAAGMHEDARVSYARASAILASTAAVKGIDTYRRILTQDESNTAVRLRLIELLMNSGDKMEAAREARILAEIHIRRGELTEAEQAYRMIDDCQPGTLDDVLEAIRRDSYDPSLQYVHYVRLGNRQFQRGDIDSALDAYRTARSLHDDQPELIEKCIECVSLIAPEAEAIPDFLQLAEKLLMSGDFSKARQVYDKVRLVDPFNNDAKCGLESVTAAERHKAAAGKPTGDDLVLKSSRAVNKRIALMDLLVACREAAQEPALATESQKLGRKD